MADPQFTRCPGCATVFRVTGAQLALREGQVRCGHCRAVFDANDHFVSLDAGPVQDEFDATDELAMGRPTVTLRSADALLPVHPLHTPGRAAAPGAHAVVPHEGSSAEARVADSRTPEGDADEAPADERAAGETRTGEGAARERTTAEGAAAEGTADEGTPGEGAAAEGTPDEGAPGKGPAEAGLGGEGVVANEAPLAPIDVRETDRAERFEWKKRKRIDGRHRGIYIGAIAVLALGLATQAVLGFRDSLAAHVPATRPLLGAVCRAFGCTIDPLRDAAALFIEASDLQADPAHRGLLLLTATIRNRADHAIAYPYLELKLTDSADQVVVVRAFAPSEYAGGTADLRNGIPANGEHIVRIFIDASATRQAGYRLYLFYP